MEDRDEAAEQESLAGGYELMASDPKRSKRNRAEWARRAAKCRAHAAELRQAAEKAAITLG